MPWKSAMVLPKASRCWTYSVAYIRAPSARPMPRAATIGRMALRPSMARRKPPTSPMTFSAGTCTSVSTSSPVSTPRTPILWSVRPTSTPSHWRSTMNALMESCARLVGSLVLAKTVYQSASLTPDIQHLVPLSTQPPSPLRRARPGVRMPTLSLASPGPLRSSLGAADGWAPSAIPGRYFAFCFSVPAIMTGPVGRRVSSSIKAAVLEYLATSSMAIARPRIPAPDPPNSVGMHRPSRPASRKAAKMSSG